MECNYVNDYGNGRRNDQRARKAAGHSVPAVRVLSSCDAQHRAAAQRGDSALSNLPALREGVSN
jgi:hypothetical protein